MDDQVTKVNNIVHSFRYQSTNFDKKGYLGYLKGTLHTSLLLSHIAPAPRAAAAMRKWSSSKERSSER